MKQEKEKSNRGTRRFSSRLNAPNKIQQKQEIVNCGTDCGYFIRNYVKISHPTKGLIPFKLFPYQEECLTAFHDHRNIIVNKSRQLGLSTLSAAYSLWLAIFQREKNIVVIATRLDTAKLFIQKVRTMYNHLPKWLVMPEVTLESVKYLQFSNGSKIQAESSSANSIRGQAISHMIFDEAAYIDFVEDIYLAAKPALSTGGSMILISSPSGVGTLFHKIWENSLENKNENGEGGNGYYAIELPWTVHPERDEKWFENEKRDILQAKGESGVGSELLCQFNSSADTFIKGDMLNALYKNVREPILKEYVDRNEVWIWKEPEEGHRYIIGADVARGDGDDYSAFHIIDTNTDEVVADFKGKLMPNKFGVLLVNWAKKYNEALICQELNNIGVVTAIKLKESGYRNVYYKKQSANIMSGLPVMESYDETELPGFTLDLNTRIEILMKLSNVLHNKKLKIYSERLYKELQTFIWKGNKPQARKHYNDDLVIALAIANNLYEASGKNSSFNGLDAMTFASAFSRDTTNIDPITGKVSNQINKQPRTSDGFWEIPKNSAVGKSYSEDLDELRQMSKNRNKVQDLNHPQWRHFRWLFDDN